MARILKRPMFSRGGSTNNGIMTGLKDRTGFADGPEDPSIYETRVRDRSTEIQNILNSLSPVPKTKLPLGQVGAELALRGTPFKEALYKGYGSYVTADDKRKAALANRKAQAVGLALGDVSKEIDLEKRLAAQAAKNDPNLALKNMFLKKSIDEGYDLPEAQRIANYQLTTKTELQNKVGRNRVAGILDFDISDQKQLQKRLPKLRDQTGMYFFDPFDGKIKLLTNKNGVLGFETFNSVDEITFAEPDVGSATVEVKPKQDVFSPEIEFASP